MEKLTHSLERIILLHEIPPNWNSYHAKVVSLRTVVRAVRVYCTIVGDALPPHISPLQNGGVQFEWATKRYSLELEIQPVDTPRSENQFPCLFENHLTKEEWERPVSIEEARDIVHRYFTEGTHA